MLCAAAGWGAGALLIAASLLAGRSALARPERVRPGIAYYSDAVLVQDGVAELGPERNYEEVYRHFEFYEAWYDAAGRVVKCIAYRQGRLLWQEVYTFDADGRPRYKQITDAEGRTRREALP